MKDALTITILDKDPAQNQADQLAKLKRLMSYEI